MILNDNTLAIIKSFANINPSILFREGNVLRTWSNGRSLLAKIELDQEFPQDFAIDELSKFLGVLGVLDQPELEFHDTYVVIKSGRSKFKYSFASLEVIDAAPNKDIPLPKDADIIEFTLKNHDLQGVLKAMNVLKLGEIAVQGDGEHIVLAAINPEDKNGDTFATVIGDTDRKFNFIYKAKNLQLIPNDYNVQISAKKISMFTAPGTTYWIAPEADSTYEG